MGLTAKKQLNQTHPEGRTMSNSQKSGYDHPWKDAVEDLFPQMIKFTNRRLYNKIDWSKPYTPANKELRQVIRPKPGVGRRFVDNLIKVHLKEGGTELLYIHIELQNDRDDDFPKRLYVYHYRLFEKFGDKIWSMAVLGDTDPQWRPSSYSHGRLGCRTTFKFPIIKLIDYEKKWHYLERSRNPFALVVMAHLMAKRTKNKPQQRIRWKINLIRLVMARKRPRKEIIALLRFIDWIIDLDPPLDKQFDQALKIELEGQPMEYLTYWERKGKKEGKKEGKVEGKKELLLALLQDKFGKLPAWAMEKLNKADTPAIESWSLSTLRKNSLEEILSA
jgi:hypothetical protein